MAQKKGFTLIEMLIVVVVIGMMLVIALSRLQGQRARIDVLLGAQQWEDTWSRTVLQMREGRRYSAASIQLTDAGITTSFSGGLVSGGTQILMFGVPLEVSIQSGGVATSGGIRHMTSYAIGCEGLGSGNLITFRREGARACYVVDTDVCTLHKRLCPVQ